MNRRAFILELAKASLTSLAAFTLLKRLVGEANAITLQQRAAVFAARPRPVVASGSSPSWTYILQENFETSTTGFDNAGWSTTGTVDPVYSTSGLSLEGSQCCRCNYGTISKAVSSTAQSWSFLFRFPTNTNDYGRNIFVIDYYGTALVYILWDPVTASTARFGIKNDSYTTVVNTAAGLSANTTYQVWVDWNTKTANKCSICFSADGTKPTSGNYAETDCVSTTSHDVIWKSGGSAFEAIYDKIRYAASAIGDNPA